MLKSGCKAEESKLRTAERLTNLLAVFCIIGWRVFWLTMVNRVTPNASANVAFTKIEIEILDRIAGDRNRREDEPLPTTSLQSQDLAAIWHAEKTRRLAIWCSGAGSRGSQTSTWGLN